MAPVPQHTPEPAGVRVTWWGHSTAWIEQAGMRLLTDPVLGDRIAHLRRRRGPAPGPADPDVVLISHLHADHLHLASLRRLGESSVVVLPAGAAAFVHSTLGPRFAARCVELAAGEQVKIDSVRVRAVHAAHDGGRGPWSRHRAQAVGYLVAGATPGRPETVTWFAGDTGLHPGMADLGPVDLALVPVGGWGPTLGAGHLDPAGGAEAVRRAAARWAVPVHYGTFWPLGFGRVRPHLFDGPGQAFAEVAAQVSPTTSVRVLSPGEAFTVPDGTGGAGGASGARGAGA